MQYKTNIKIIIDKRKIDTLFRLGCPDEIILDLIKTGNVAKTGDTLIDELLETLVDVKEFTNWGGKRLNAGRKNQDKNQVENHLENHLASNLEDKDIDKDIELDKDKDNIIIYLKGILKEYYKREFNTQSWGKAIRSMIKTDKIPAERIIESLVWYKEHIGQEYIPVIQSGTSLREKFTKLENAMKREKKETEEQFKVRW
jgi:hypothetical protein